MFKTKIDVIPHKKQRLKNGDVADYFDCNGVSYIRISDSGEGRYNFLVALHELVELFLVKEAGIPISDIDDWDCKYPEIMGDSKQAPYHKQHVIATKVEKFAAKLMGVNWKEYEKALERLNAD